MRTFAFALALALRAEVARSPGGQIIFAFDGLHQLCRLRDDQTTTRDRRSPRLATSLLIRRPKTDARLNEQRTTTNREGKPEAKPKRDRLPTYSFAQPKTEFDFRHIG